jgi:hypothetical protein
VSKLLDRPRLLTALLGSGLAVVLMTAGCESSDSTPAQKFEKPAGVKDDATGSLDDIYKKQKSDRGDDGSVKAGKAKQR